MREREEEIISEWLFLQHCQIKTGPKPFLVDCHHVLPDNPKPDPFVQPKVISTSQP
jgi:hypothetical protein